MKNILLIIIFIITTGCSTEHRAPIGQLNNLYIDCTNRTQYENYLNLQLKLTDFTKVAENSEERKYYAAIKDKIWALRSTCK